MTSALGSQEWLRLRIGVGLDLPPEAIAAAGGKRPGRDYPALADAQGGFGGSG